MGRVLGFVRAFSVFIAALLLLLSVALPVGAAQSGAAAIAKPAARAPSTAVTPQSRAEALAARRAVLRRDLRGAGRAAVVRSAAVEEAKARRLPTSKRRALEAQARALAVQEQGSGPSTGVRRPSLFEAPAESRSSSSSSEVEGEPAGFAVGDGVETLASGIAAGDDTEAVTPGEQLTIAVYAFVSGDSSEQVDVSFSESCGLSATSTIGSQSVTAPPIGNGNVGTLVTQDVTVPSDCPYGFDDDGLYAYNLTWSVTPAGGEAGSGEALLSWTDVPEAQLTACDCSTDSADAGSAQADAGDPVDTVSGAYAMSVTDASLRSPGYPLTISRSYSSANTSPGPLGPGWSVPWDASLSIDSSTGNITFTAENGDQYLYYADGGIYYSDSGARSVLAQETNSSGDVTGYTLTDPSDHDLLTFSTSGQMESETESTGQGLTFLYNSSGQVGSITDAAGEPVSLTYDGSLLSQVALPDGQDVSYGYNTDGELTSVTDPGDAEWQYTYNSAGLLATVEDPNQNLTVQNTYNSSGQVTQQEDGDGNYTYFTYTTTSSGVSETNAEAPKGGITSYLYVGGMLQEEIGPVDDAATYSAYNEFLEPVTVTDPMGRDTSYGYNADGDLTSETSDLDHTQFWSYDSNGNLLSYENADYQTTNYSYNSMDEMLTETTPKNEETQYTYNANGSLASEISARDYTSNYSYYSGGMLESVANPDTDKTSYTYNSMGYPLTVTDPMTHATTYGYNAAEEVSSVTTPAGETKYGYDADGNLTSREDPDLNTWTYKYNADGELAKATDPLGNSDSYGYDGDGNQDSFTDGRDIVTSTTYNLADEPTEITYSDGTPSVSYVYDADGEVTSVGDGTGTRALSYNGDGELTGEGGFSYGYDDAGNITSREYPDGTTTSYGYNDDGEVSTMTVGSAETSYSYDADGNLTSTAKPDGMTESRTYDNADQLTGVSDATSSSTLDSYGLTLNADGQPTAIAVTQDGAAEPSRYYGYNTDGEMTSECYSSSGSSACSAASEGTASGSATSTAAPSGSVTSGETGLCAEDASAATTSGNKIDVDTCDGASAQTWTATDSGTVEVLDNCLSASGTTSGDVVELEPCTAHDTAEQWRQGTGWELVNPASGLCLTDPSGSTTTGTQLEVVTCAADTYQEWRLPEDATGFVTNGEAGKCMDDKSSGTAAGTVEDIYSCNGTAAQDWTVDGWSFEIESLCLEPSGAGTAQNTGLVIETCVSGTTAQEWAAGPDGWVWNVNAAKCAADPDGTTTNGTQLSIAGCASPLSTQQTWRVPGTLAPDGALTSGVSGKCADDSSSSTTAGNKIDSYTCNSSGAQDWTLAADGELQVLANCATIAATTADSLVELEPCTDAVTQKWAVGPSGAWVEATDAGTSQLCLSDPSNSTTNGTQLEIIACAGDTGQDWAPASTTVPATVTGVTVTAGAGSATVSWTPPISAGGESITGYVVTASGGQKADASVYATSATVSGLTAGTSYAFTVTAQTSLGTSVSAATTAITPGNGTSYTYDSAGNLISSEADGVTTTNSYNADEELTTSVTGSTTTAYGYDDDGNQTRAGTTTYSYKDADEMTGVDTAAGDFTYSYNSAGDLADTDLDGTEINDTIWDLNNPLPEVAEDTTSSGSVTSDYNWNPNDTLNSQTEDGATGTGTTYDAITDWEGSLTGLANSTGTQVSDTNYSAYGTPSTTGTEISSIGYTGSYALAGSGNLDDMRARDYSSAIEGFAEVDPLLDETGQPYTYAGGNPVAYEDLSGLCLSGFGWACWLGQHTGQISTVVGTVGLVVVVGATIITCVVCDTIGVALDVIGTALNAYSTYQDWEDCNYEGLAFDIPGLLFGIVGLGGDFGGWLTVAGDGGHAAEESAAHFPFVIGGVAFDVGSTAFGWGGWYVEGKYSS